MTQRARATCISTLSSRRSFRACAALCPANRAKPTLETDINHRITAFRAKASCPTQHPPLAFYRASRSFSFFLFSFLFFFFRRNRLRRSSRARPDGEVSRCFPNRRTECSSTVIGSTSIFIGGVAVRQQHLQTIESTVQSPTSNLIELSGRREICSCTGSTLDRKRADPGWIYNGATRGRSGKDAGMRKV